jgi:hypothetical protein
MSSPSRGSAHDDLGAGDVLQRATVARTLVRVHPGIAVSVVGIAVVQGIGIAELVSANPWRSKLHGFAAVLTLGASVLGFRSRREGLCYWPPGGRDVPNGPVPAARPG